jgi:hypothetical protein
MRIMLSDPADTSRFGAWTSPDVIDDAALAAGAIRATFQVDSTSSAGPDELYDMTPPPSFSAPVTISGRVDEDGALLLFLAPDVDDESFPFATLPGFRDALRGTGPLEGAGELHRPNQLGPDIAWSVAN